MCMNTTNTPESTLSASSIDNPLVYLVDTDRHFMFKYKKHETYTQYIFNVTQI